MHGQFQNVDRENTNSVNLAEKTSILQDLLRKHHSANNVQKNKTVIKLKTMFSFLRKKRCPFPAVCDQCALSLECLSISFPFLWSRNLCLCLWLYCLSVFLCLSICCGKPGAQVVWTLFGFVPLQVSCQSLSLWREGWRWLGSTWNLQSLENAQGL